MPHSPLLAPPRVAVVCEGDPSNPEEWSGTPYGLVGGLRAEGIDVVTIAGAARGRVARVARDVVALMSARPAAPTVEAVKESLRQSRRAAPFTAEFGSTGTLYARSGLLAHRGVDAVVQMGSAYTIRHPRVATFEDMTVRQAVEHDQYQWGELTERQVSRRVERQRSVYRRATAVLSATPWAAESMRRDYGVSAAKVRAIGLGCNHEASPDGRDWSVPRFLFVGNDWARKNGDLVVRAFRVIRETAPEATLDLVGGHPRVDEPGVTGHGRLRLSDAAESARLDALFGASTCLVVPSRFEAAGIVYLEAAAAGMATIGGRAGGAPHLIGGGGMTVAPTDAAGLVDAMRRMCDPQVARAFGESGRARSAEFTWPAVARRVLTALGLRCESTPVTW
ncbi:glycosyltransferase family 4 protein [Mobilicoccus massiliensis]|uniref:glycosyltransferase family 4 protein n=1 Tax=Mobilicoccus massiliensis TaxID=1522310 RepID=UPI00058F6F64|nr:glycosyltransferase family 4 protein [Mobilicoccus massiliensis]